MMRQYELVERVTGYIENPDEALLNKAYVYAMQKHGTQKRASGDPYFSHPLEVAAILTELRLDEETIAVALLHDTLEDTDATRNEIDRLFGDEIGVLVDGLTKLKKLDLVSKRAKQAENLRRLFLAISKDVRVLLVKLADRLHNMRTLGPMRPDKRVRIATETMEIYAPLAGRMGMQDLRDELEELSFSQINPEAYQGVKSQLAELADKNRNLISEISETLRSRLAEQNMPAVVKGRQKKPYSVFRKMQSKALGFEQLSDIYGFRIIVDSVEECYRALGIVHTDWRMVPGRFKDFISLPKQNEYRSIHTTIVGPSNQRVELQIRTREMDDVAEFGIAAHTAYKDGEDAFEDSSAYASLRKTIEQLAEADNPEEFLEHTKLELFLDQVFCFTPKGQIITLPRGATPIDFAYAVHTDIGNRCIGCKLNGKIMPLITELNNGDEVEIILGDGAQTPPAAWEGIVATGKARSSIRRACRQAIRRQYCALGTRLLERAFEEAGYSYRPGELEVVLPRLARDTVDDVTAEVGRNEMPAGDVLQAVYPDTALGSSSDPTCDRTHPQDKPDEQGKFAEGREIPIRGLDGELPVTFPKIGGGVPGDSIVGVLMPGEGIAIHHSDAPILEEFESAEHRLIDVRWDIEKTRNKRFPARLDILGRNAPGTLATITRIIAEFEGNISNLNLQVLVDDFAELKIDVEVWDQAHLSRIINELGKQQVVTKVSRSLSE